MSDTEYKTWLYSLERRELLSVAADNNIDPGAYDTEDDLIEAIVEALQK